jgi:hypothetical protein
MRAAPRLIGYRLGEPMSAIYPPEQQQSPPQPPSPEVPYWRRPWPKRAGIAVLAVAVLLVGVGIGCSANSHAGALASA